MRLLIISDTHNFEKRFIEIYGYLPDADVIIHAGDLTNWGGRKELRNFAEWWNSLPHPNKIFIAGNHDYNLYNYPELSGTLAGHYLLDSWVRINGIKFWGSPYTPKYKNYAFLLNRHTLRKVWDKIPPDTDILITHCPPYGYGDLAGHSTHSMERIGCEYLTLKIHKLQPKLHICGHVHEDFGIRRIDATTTINASSYLGLTYKPQPSWIIFDI